MSAIPGMKRHEAWRYRYRLRRDLDHLNDSELSERLHDLLNNIRNRSANGKIDVRPVDGRSEAWWALFTEVLEECSLRGYEYPGPINISQYRSALDHAFDPIPDMDRAIKRYDLHREPYLLKFGTLRWLSESMERGAFRVASAAYYDSEEHNHARRDTELRRYINLNPDNPLSLDSTHGRGWSFVEHSSDYYLMSFAEHYRSRLFGDFAANACLVVFDRRRFLSRLQRALAARLPGWQIQTSRVAYYDPIRADPTRIVVPTCKPFKHAYQEEVRVLALPNGPVAQLDPVHLELGPLSDCAALVDLTTYPPALVPHDPLDDPIQHYGSVNQEHQMVNHLPDVSKMQGLVLNKGSHGHEDWTFQVQYTDAAGTWHEIKMPMLDGLYLLNMLRTAEEEQRLKLWNQPPNAP